MDTLVAIKHLVFDIQIYYRKLLIGYEINNSSL